MTDTEPGALLRLAVMATPLVVASTWLMLLVTWQLGPDTGTLLSHAHAAVPAAWGLLRGDSSLWSAYWAEVTRHGHHWVVTARATASVLVSTLVTVAGVWIAYHSETRSYNDRHVSGPELYERKNAVKHAARMLLSSGDQAGIRIHPTVPVGLRAETGNCAVFGQQGSGKTVALTPMFHQIIERGDRVLLLDEKREYTPIFYRRDRAIIICPADARSHVWDVAADSQGEELAMLVATHLIGADTNDPFWSDGGRLILTGIICALNCMHTGKWGWPELSDAITWDRRRLSTNLQRHYPIAQTLVAPDSKTTDGFLMTISNRLAWLPGAASLWSTKCANRFSIRDWVNGRTDENLILVPTNPTFEAITRPLLATFMSLMTKHTLALTDSRERRIWLGLDELASLPKTPALVEWLSKARSKGARTLVGFQNFSQLQAIYGEHDAETIGSLFANVVALRCGSSGGSAERVSAIFGERQLDRRVSTVSSKGEVSTSFQRVSEPVVRAESLIHLPMPSRKGIDGYLCLGGTNSVYKLRWPYANFPVIAEGFVSAKTEFARPSKVTSNRKRKRV